MCNDLHVALSPFVHMMPSSAHASAHCLVALQLLIVATSPSRLLAQDTLQNGSIAGNVLDDRGEPIVGAQVHIARPAISSTTRQNGAYVLRNAPPGRHTVRVRMLGFQPDSATVLVAADRQSGLDFTLRRDPLHLQTLIVTGTQVPRQNLAASVAVT